MTAATRAHRIETLTRAAQTKSAAAQARAETGLRTLIKNQQPITFRSVAKTAGVSLDFLYRNPELRRRIDTLRAQQQPAPPATTPTTHATQTSAVVAGLTTKLRESRHEITQLRAQLAIAHGELAALRRTTRTVSTPPDPAATVKDTLVTDASSTN
jgi:Tfp pilus assembly protein FimV